MQGKEGAIYELLLTLHPRETWTVIVQQHRGLSTRTVESADHAVSRGEASRRPSSHYVYDN